MPCIHAREPDADSTLSNFICTHLLSTLVTLKIGFYILKEEHVEINWLYGHGGFFKTKEVGQRLLSAAVGAPISVMETAGDGGTYGMALLAQYLIGNEGKNLPSWLDEDVFKDAVSITIKAGGGRMRRLQCIPR